MQPNAVLGKFGSVDIQQKKRKIYAYINPASYKL